MAKQALPGTRANAFYLDPEELTIVGFDTKHKRGEHKLWDKRILKFGKTTELTAKDRAMINSIKSHGVLKPVHVRKDGDAIEIVDGRRRTYLCRIANAELKAEGKEPVKIMVLPKKGTDVQLFGISRAMNEMHEEDDPLTKAENAQLLLDYGKSEDEVATFFGIDTNTLKTTWLPLLDLDDKVREAVESKAMSPTAAVNLAGLKREEQRKALKDMKTTGKMTVAVAQNVARQRKAKAKGETAVSMLPPKKILLRVVQLADYSRVKLDSHVVLGMKYMLGLISVDKIKGLRDAIKSAS